MEISHDAYLWLRSKAAARAAIASGASCSHGLPAPEHGQHSHCEALRYVMQWMHSATSS